MEQFNKPFAKPLSKSYSKPLSKPLSKPFTPAVVDLEPGEYKWCSCGASKTQPYCDHSHRELNTGQKSVRFTIESKKRVALCMCKHTNTPPFCDGTHTRINAEMADHLVDNSDAY